MDEALEFCRRMLGGGPLAEEAAAVARGAADGRGDRVGLLHEAARACRERADRAQPQAAAVSSASGGLAAAVAAEVATAVSVLPERQREALILSERLRLSHAQIARVLELEPAAVAPVLARARLRLRAERRGDDAVDTALCEDRDRALRLIACRQDSEPLGGEDDDWLFDHLGTCEECSRAHAAMLEASACYRAAR